MYDRSPRSLNLVVGCTPEHVGPGTYNHRRQKITEESFAPFLSLSNRGDIFSNDENPGPGHYELRSDRSSTIKGGSTLANKANRFYQKPSETPGPGTYTPHTSQSSYSSASDLVKHPRQNTFRYNRKSLAPSIPDPKFAYGFEEDSDGKFVSQPAPDSDPTLGPAFYNTSATKENDASKLYHGVHFGKYSSKRTDFSGKLGPGPGDYDPNDKVKLEIRHMNLKKSDIRPELQIPRYPENILKTAAKESVPGPGQYSIKRELDPELSKSDIIIGLEFERPGFGAQTDRFNTHASGVPGPATYNDTVVTAFSTTQTKPTSFKRTPFNQTTARFSSNDYKTRSEPGPGQYRIPGFADDSLRRAIVEEGKKPPFNVASVRRLNIARKDEFYTPGPSSYDVKTEPFKSKMDHPSSIFISNTPREPIIEESPGPTAYDVPRAYQALTSQHRQPPRSKNAQKRHYQFLSAAKRKFGSETSLNTPGPAAYDGFITPRTHGYAPVYGARFRNDNSKIPGPADYELSPLFEDTVLLGTFNSTLNNPILAKLQIRILREEKAAAEAAAAEAAAADAEVARAAASTTIVQGVSAIGNDGAKMTHA